MTHEEFLQWLDWQIDHSALQEKEQSYDPEAVEFCKGYGDAMKEVRAKFLTLTPIPPNSKTD